MRCVTWTMGAGARTRAGALRNEKMLWKWVWAEPATKEAGAPSGVQGEVEAWDGNGPASGLLVHPPPHHHPRLHRHQAFQPHLPL